LTPSGQTVSAVPGQDLFSGQGLRTTGDDSAAVVRYPDTTRLELGADTLVRLLRESTGKQVNLSEGVLVADVVRQPEGQPMVLTTPHVEVRAQETRFSSASLPEVTRLDPERGSLQVTRRSDGRSVEVAGGSYLVAALRDDVPGVRPFAPRTLPEHFQKPRAILKETSGPVPCVAVSPDGKTIASGCADGLIRLWQVVPPGSEPKVLGFRWGSVNLTASSARSTLNGFTKSVRTLAFAPDGKTLAAVNDERLARVWNVATGQEQPAFRGRVNSLTFLPDGTVVTVGGTGKVPEVKLWSNGREQLLPLSTQREPVCVAGSPDGRLLAAGFIDGSVRLWDLRAGPGTSSPRELQTLQAHTKDVRCLAFSPDSKVLATGGRDQTVWLWDTTTWSALGVLTEQPAEVRVLAFAPDGKTLVGGGGNGTLLIWDVLAGHELRTFRADKRAVLGLAFAPDGRTLVTSGADRTTKLWDAVTDSGF
jgi:WD40 repeat protein